MKGRKKCAGSIRVLKRALDGTPAQLCPIESKPTHNQLYKKGLLYAQLLPDFFFIHALFMCRINASLGQWASDPSKNTPVDTGGHSAADVVMLKDGAGGAFVVWDDTRAASGIPKIFAQHLDKNGNALWTANGLEICPGGADQILPQVAAVGDGGIIVSWAEQDRDSVLGSPSPAIFAQRIAPNGTLSWGNAGLAIAEPEYLQLLYPISAGGIAADGFGGAYVSWTILNYGFQNLMVSRIDSSGNIRWSLPAMNGWSTLSSGLPDGGYLKIQLLQNGTSGVIVAWTDVRNAFTTGISLFAQKLDITGARQWDTLGVALAPKPSYLQQQTNEAIVSDNAGGAICAWEQSYSGSSPHAYAGHINSSGALTWISPTDSVGVLVDSNASTGQENISMISGENGTALLTWTDGADVAYVQNIASNGSLPWGAKPAPIAANTSGEVLTTDGNGGAIVAWTQGLQNGLNIFAQHVNSSGQPVWSNPTYGTSGNPVSTTPSTYQEHPVIVSDDAGGAIVAWYDLRASSYGGPFDIYAQHIGSNGSVTKVNTQASSVPTEFSLSQNYPNPFNPSTMIQFTVPSSGRAVLKIFNILGQEVATLFNGEAAAGVSHQVEFNASNFASGIYFSRLEFDGKMQMKKMMLLK